MWPDNIEQVIPHRGAMRWVERVLDWDEQRIVVGLTVPLDGPFHEAGGVPAWVGLEYMAQAIGAWSGCRARHRGGQPRIGFLLGTRRYHAEVGHFAPGAALRVEARCELADGNGLGMFACCVMEGEQVLASANVSVYEPDDARIQELIES
jgi:predicted hotdog family 3-hydroxylacyl-ACP dehydratase